MQDLKDKTIKSIFWFSIEKFGIQIIQFVLSIILARLLTPSDYGTVGMVLVFIAILNSIVESGLSQALIRKVSATKEDYDTVFLFNIISAFLLFIVMFIAAPYISAFYNIPDLDLVTKVISVNLIIISFSLIQSTILYKRINFKKQTKIALISIIISSAVSLTIAASGYGYWALVFQILIFNFTKTILLWATIRWKPTFRFSFVSFKELYGFGSKLFFAGVIETIFQNVISLIIGKIFSTQILGLYSQAKKIQETPTSNLSQIIQKVTYPALATIQDDNIKLKRGFQKSIILIMLINAPMMVCLFVVSDSFIEVVLSHKWIDASVFLKLLTLMGVVFPLHPLNLNIIKVKGRPDLFFRLQIIKTIIALSLAIIGLYWGIIGLLISQILSAYIAYYLNAFYSGVMVDYSISEQIKDIYPYLLFSFLSFFPVYFFQYIFSDFFFLLLIQIIAGGLLYIYLNYRFKTEGYIELLSLSKTYLKFKTT